MNQQQNNLTMKTAKNQQQLFQQPSSKYLEPTSIFRKDSQSIKKENLLWEIRQSGYKLPKSKSNRKDHSLQRKLPFKYNQQYKKKDYSNYNQSKSIKLNSERNYNSIATNRQKNKNSINKIKQKQKYQSLQIQNRSKIVKCEQQFNQNAVIINFHTVNLNKREDQILIACAKVIQQKIKIMKQQNKIELKEHVSVLEETINIIINRLTIQTQNQKEQLIQNQYITQNTQQSYIITQNQYPKNKNQQLLQKIYEFHQKLSLMNPQNKLTHVESNLSSVLIQNECSHQYEYLYLYDSANLEQKQNHEVQDPYRLRQITINQVKNKSQIQKITLKQLQQKILKVKTQEQDDNIRSDRIFLKNIVKKVQTYRPEIQSNKHQNNQNDQTKKQKNQSNCENKEVNSYKSAREVKPKNNYINRCEFLQCGTAALSSNSCEQSDQKRKLLNQIINTLNGKYNRNIQLPTQQRHRF